MLKVKRHKQFIKDLRKSKLSDQHFSKYIIYLSKIIQKEKLPPEALDHPLKGDYKDCREFHISGDVLIIYTIDNDILKLIRMGLITVTFGTFWIICLLVPQLQLWNAYWSRNSP
jgi:mRNA interferase YafQ